MVEHRPQSPDQTGDNHKVKEFGITKLEQILGFSAGSMINYGILNGSSSPGNRYKVYDPNHVIRALKVQHIKDKSKIAQWRDLCGHLMHIFSETEWKGLLSSDLWKGADERALESGIDLFTYLPSTTVKMIKTDPQLMQSYRLRILARQQQEAAGKI